MCSMQRTQKLLKFFTLTTCHKCCLLRLDGNTSENIASCALKVMLQMAVPLRGFDRTRLGPLKILCLQGSEVVHSACFP